MKAESVVRLMTFLLLIAFVSGALAQEEEFQTSRIMDLRPTQGAVGYRAIAEKAEKLRNMSRAELGEYLVENPVPVVRGPRGELYMVDHHHLTRALMDIGRDAVFIHVVEDWSRRGPEAFWKKMEARGYARLADENGRRIEALQLPRTVMDIPDDPYRSLAAAARERDAFKKTSVFFAEFKWADYYREHIPREDFERLKWKDVVKEAQDFSRSIDAIDLPGFIGPARCRSVWGL